MLFRSLSLYFQPKFITMFFLGFSSGLPLVLTASTLSIWLTEAAVDKTTIGLFAIVATPYTLKFLWAPLVDQLSLPYLTRLLGRRTSWMILSQVAIIFAIIALGSTDPWEEPWYAALFAFLLAFSSATQDIVIDAYRVETLKENEQGLGAGMAVFGYRVAMLVSGAGALLLAEYFSWFVVYLLMAVCGIVGIITILIAGEPNNSAAYSKYPRYDGLVKWIKQAVVTPFSDFTLRHGWLVILLFITFYKFGDALAGTMTSTFFIEAGFSKAEIAGIIKIYGFGATMVGTFTGGILIYRIGLIKGLWLCGILQMLSNLMFAVQATVGYNTELLAITIGFENFSGGMGTAALVAYLSSLCNISYTATQYALLSSFSAMGRTWLSASAGYLVEQFDWVYFFIFTTVAAIPGLIFLMLLTRYIPQTIAVKIRE